MYRQLKVLLFLFAAVLLLHPAPTHAQSACWVDEPPASSPQTSEQTSEQTSPQTSPESSEEELRGDPLDPEQEEDFGNESDMDIPPNIWIDGVLYEGSLEAIDLHDILQVNVRYADYPMSLMFTTRGQAIGMSEWIRSCNFYPWANVPKCFLDDKRITPTQLRKLDPATLKGAYYDPMRGLLVCLSSRKNGLFIPTDHNNSYFYFFDGRKSLPGESQMQELIRAIRSHAELSQASFQGGGVEEFRTWFIANLKHPSYSRDSVVQRVLAYCMVDKRGKLKAQIVESEDPALSRMVINTLRSSPRWTPATEGGKPIQYQFYLPFKFYRYPAPGTSSSKKAPKQYWQRKPNLSKEDQTF